jgi:hypothetical protein
LTLLNACLSWGSTAAANAFVQIALEEVDITRELLDRDLV